MSNKLNKAIEYLRQRKIYRGDVNHNHKYDPYTVVNDYTKVTVTVCCKGHHTVNHATRGPK